MNVVNKYISSLSEESFSYLVSAVLFVLAIVSNKLFSGYGSTTLLWLALIALEIGLINFLIPIVQKLWKSSAGKVVLSYSAVAGSALCMSFAGQIINGYFEVSVIPFLYTQTIVSLLISPLVISIIFGLVSIFLLPLMMVLFMSGGLQLSLKKILIFWQYEPNNDINGFLIICRLIGFVSLIGLSWVFNSNNVWFTDPVGKFAKWYAYSFEMDSFSHCSHDDKERISYINKDDIVIGIDNGKEITFRTSTCSRK